MANLRISLCAPGTRANTGEVSNLITTRLDSDDALAASYIERSQLAARHHRGFINFYGGIQLVGDSVLYTVDTSNPFLSFVEEAVDANIQTVLSIEHYRAREAAPVLQLGGVAWLQVLHGGNVANLPAGCVFRRRDAERLLGYPLPRADGYTRLTFTQHCQAITRLVGREVGSRLRRGVSR